MMRLFHVRPQDDLATVLRKYIPIFGGQSSQMEQELKLSLEESSVPLERRGQLY